MVHQVLAGSDTHNCLYMLGTITKLAMLFQESMETESKKKKRNIKNVRRCWDDMPLAKKVGMMHESKGQYIGKTPSLTSFLHYN